MRRRDSYALVSELLCDEGARRARPRAGGLLDVCTDDEFAVTTAAVLSSLGCPRPAPVAVAVALALRDKAVQKRRVRAAGIAVADRVRCPDLAAVRSLPLDAPFVVKPPAGAGSQPPPRSLFFSHVHLHGGPAPVRRFLPELLQRIGDRRIDPGKVFDLSLPLNEAAEGYRAMDERRAIKALLRP